VISLNYKSFGIKENFEVDEMRYNMFTTFIQLQQLLLKSTIEYVGSTCKNTDQIINLKRMCWSCTTIIYFSYKIDK